MDVVTSMDVANTIIRQAIAKNIPVSPMKLQRLLYLTYAGYLQESGRKLFPGQFQCWAYGPVESYTYWKFQCFRTKPIDRLGRDAMGIANTIDLSSDRTFRHVFADLCEVYMPIGPKALCEITRMKDSAWYKAFQAGKETIEQDDIAIDPCWQSRLH